MDCERTYHMVRVMCTTPPEFEDIFPSFRTDPEEDQETDDDVIFSQVAATFGTG